jgi:hypothetical protein
MALFNVTYDIVTPESAEQGDYDECGFIAEGISLRDAIALVAETRTNRVSGVESIECDSSSGPPRWVTVFNGMEYETGACESRSLHIPPSVSPATACRIARLLGAHGYR